MDKISILRHYGLFDAKVPRYTSYPPANRFENDVGARNQRAWLARVPKTEPVSIYVHIPFCRRLCWFCACRTQGTQTLTPVEGYVTDLIKEIEAAVAVLGNRHPMARLHLGGGTPTLLPADVMDGLLQAVFDAFRPTNDFEFSVEIDPTEAAPEVLSVLAERGMDRASIGVQDFAPKVQKTIGRVQSYTETAEVVDALRAQGVQSLNIDLLYGLPYQSTVSLMQTLDQIATLRPDRLALYGYAHVPHMSKRQAMIPTDALPSVEERFLSSEMAQEKLLAMGYEALGIDHFAVATDSLAQSARSGRLRRNFQGYTDDPCETLLGFGASAISKYREGYSQNAVSTVAYRQRAQSSGLAAHKGYVMSAQDMLIAALVEAVMCRGEIDAAEIAARQGCSIQDVAPVLERVSQLFTGLLDPAPGRFALLPGFGAAARLIAAELDTALQEHHIHSQAI